MATESKVDSEQLEAFTSYIKSVIEQLQTKTTNQTDAVKKVYGLGEEIHDQWSTVKKYIAEYNQEQANITVSPVTYSPITSNVQTESTNVKSDNNSTSQSFLSQLEALKGFSATSSIIKKLPSLITVADDKIENLRDTNYNLTDVCTRILENIKKIENILNKNPALRKNALEAGIINFGKLSMSAGDALVEKNVNGVLSYEEGWDDETHFIFKDGTFLVKSGNDLNGYIGASSLAKIIGTVAENDSNITFSSNETNTEETISNLSPSINQIQKIERQGSTIVATDENNNQKTYTIKNGMITVNQSENTPLTYNGEYIEISSGVGASFILPLAKFSANDKTISQSNNAVDYGNKELKNVISAAERYKKEVEKKYSNEIINQSKKNNYLILNETDENFDLNYGGVTVPGKNENEDPTVILRTSQTSDIDWQIDTITHETGHTLDYNNKISGEESGFHQYYDSLLKKNEGLINELQSDPTIESLKAGKNYYECDNNTRAQLNTKIDQIVNKYPEANTNLLSGTLWMEIAEGADKSNEMWGNTFENYYSRDGQSLKNVTLDNGTNLYDFMKNKNYK